MGGKNDQNFIAFCDELREYVEEHHLFSDKYNDYFRESVALNTCVFEVKEGPFVSHKDGGILP